MLLSSNEFLKLQRLVDSQRAFLCSIECSFSYSIESLHKSLDNKERLLMKKSIEAAQEEQEEDA